MHPSNWRIYPLDFWIPLCSTQVGALLRNNPHDVVPKPFLELPSPRTIPLPITPEGYAASWSSSCWAICLASCARAVLGSCPKLSGSFLAEIDQPYHLGSFFFTCFEAPNRLQLMRERPSPDESRRYRNARSQQALYKAAARLWRHGVDIAEAITIVSSAVQESVHQ